jgi:hypothetical protein
LANLHFTILTPSFPSRNPSKFNIDLLAPELNRTVAVGNGSISIHCKKKEGAMEEAMAQRAAAGLSHTDRQNEGETSTKAVIDRPADNGRRLIIYRDPADVRTVFQLLAVLMVVLCLFVLSAIGNAWQYWRRPDRIVVDRSNGRVLVINDREFGETDAVKMALDRPGDEDKKYLVGEFLRLIYAVNPATRAADVKSALEMMVPQSAAKFAAYLKEQGVLERQRAEVWQAVWTPQDVSIDRVDPYTLRVIGMQQITKLVNNTSRQESKQLQLTVKLAADPAGRNDPNRRTGFLVMAVDYKELNQ